MNSKCINRYLKLFVLVQISIVSDSQQLEVITSKLTWLPSPNRKVVGIEARNVNLIEGKIGENEDFIV